MKYTHLGRSGLSVSRLCLGTMNFGPQTDELTACSIMDAAQEAGINFFDTANVYGGTKHRGWTEEILGRWFAQGGERREKTVLATKLYGGMTDRPNDEKLSALNIRRALDASLKRLQTDHIDVYQFHHVDRDTPWDEIWQAVEVAVQQGKVLYSGSSNFAGWHIAQAQAAAAQRNYPAWSANSPSITCSPAPLSWKSFRRRRSTAWASSRGRHCMAGCSAECCTRRPQVCVGPRAGHVRR